MSRVSHFQRFSQPENHATNNTLLVLRHLYQSSPYKIQRLLASLLETDFVIGLTFEQQVRGVASVPDALISQHPLRVFVETKRGGAIDTDQISRHFSSISSNQVSDATNDVLIALTKEPLSDATRKALTAEGAQQRISFAAITFSQVVDALRQQCAEFETDLNAIIEDYEAYLADEGLLEERNQWIVVFPCGLSITENARYGVYYEPPSRPCKRNHRFIGVYKNKAINYIGAVQTITIASWADDKFIFDDESGKLSSDQKSRIEAVIAATPYYDLKEAPCRFYVVDRFVETCSRKVSPGGIMGYRYLDLTKLIPGYQPKRDYSTEELAKELHNSTWE